MRGERQLMMVLICGIAFTLAAVVAAVVATLFGRLVGVSGIKFALYNNDVGQEQRIVRYVRAQLYRLNWIAYHLACILIRSQQT